MSGKEEGQFSTCSDEELLHIALTDADEDVVWKAIAELHQRGSRDSFERARRLCLSEDAHERIIGADILAQLGLPNGTFHEEAVTTLVAMLEREQEPEVLSALASAVGHRHDERTIEPLARLKDHPDERVRFSVVWDF